MFKLDAHMGTAQDVEFFASHTSFVTRKNFIKNVLGQVLRPRIKMFPAKHFINQLHY